jgi:hypothetical protein
MKAYRVYKAFNREDRGSKQCEGKKQYFKKTAIEVAKRTRRSGREREMRVYQCPMCNHWHIAHADRYMEENYRSK